MRWYIYSDYPFIPHMGDHLSRVGNINFTLHFRKAKFSWIKSQNYGCFQSNNNKKMVFRYREKEVPNRKKKMGFLN